jgi:hypothetical protein
VLRARAIIRSATAIAPAALIDGRVSELLMRARQIAPAVHDQVHSRSAPLIPGNF